MRVEAEKKPQKKTKNTHTNALPASAYVFLHQREPD